MRTLRERNLISMVLLLLFAAGTYFTSRVSMRHALWSLALLVAFAVFYAAAEKTGWADEFYAPGSFRPEGTTTPRSDWKGGAFFALVCGFYGAYVALTGGLHSPFFGIIYLPLILAGLRYGVMLGILLSTLAAAIYLVIVSPMSVAPTFGVPVFLTFPLAGLFGAVLHTRLRGSFRQVSDKIAELDALIDVSQMLETAIDLNTSLNLILINNQQVIDSDACAIYLLDPDGTTLRLAASIGMREEDHLARTTSMIEMKMGTWYLGDDDLFARSRPVCVGASNIETAWLENRSSHALYATLAGPEGLIGLIYTTRTDCKHPFDETERATMKRFAAHIGMPLHKARFQDSLEQLAYRDQMTGLSNFRYFERRLFEEVSRAKRYRQDLSLLMLDIDFFKKFNDRYGHRAGDSLLNHFGSILRETLRESDLPARYGGEEFAVICPGTSSREAYMIAERIRGVVERTPFELEASSHGETATAKVTVSIGIATYPTCSESQESLIWEADRALYAAKKRGRNGVVVSEERLTGEERMDYPSIPSVSR